MAASTEPSPRSQDTPRRGLWAEIALALALLTLATILLNAGVFWLLYESQATNQQSEIALSLGRSLRAQLEAEGNDPQLWKRALVPYKRSALDLEALWIVDPQQKVAARSIGAPPENLDSALRAALYTREESVRIKGRFAGEQIIQVTEPLVHGGAVVAALRLEMPAGGGVFFGGRLPFFLIYTLTSGLVIAVFGYSLFRQRLVAPIQTLQEGTRRIAGGEFGHQLDLESVRELEQLSEALNQMSGSLADYRSRTGEQVRHLEEANAELRRIQEELIRSEKMASVGRLAAGIAHELGNPLAVVLGYNELLRDGLGDPALEQDLLARAGRELERIQRIIRDLLDFARPGSGRSSRASVRQLLQDAAGTVQHLPQLKGVAFEIQAAPELPDVLVEPDKVHQILVNLFLNAGDAMGGDGQIHLGVSARDGAVAISCRDDGPGFPPEILGQVFDPFFTTKAPGEGTGLGLSISLRIAEDMGGGLRVANAPSGGAEVTLTLPVAPPESTPTELSA